MVRSYSEGELLLRWQEFSDQGQVLSPEELCHSCPNRVDKLRDQIELLEQMERVALLGTTPYVRPGAASPVWIDPADPYPLESTPNPLLPHIAIPGYEILSLLGQGGMGVVYKARQIQAGRVVALKMLRHGEILEPELLDRFHTEVEAVARLSHPGIVQIFEVGENRGQPFFSLEYCSGGSLEERLRETALPVREAAALLEQVAWAMQYAHEKGIIHRDLKSGNILLDDSGYPRITDFGLARKLDTGGHTLTGAVMGTASYMPPEQAKGRIHEIGPLSDVYSLSATFYEMLTGRRPFVGSSTLETLRLVCEADPTPPRQLQPDIPRDLEVICLKGLQKEPQHRYRSASELANDLGRFLRGEPIQAHPVSPAVRVWKWTKRQPATAALIACSLLLLACATFGGLFYGLYQAQLGALLREQLEREESVARLWQEGTESKAAAQLALERKQLAEAIREFTRAAESLDRALAMLDLEPPGSSLHGRREEILSQREEVRLFLDEQTDRQQLLARIDQFERGREEVMFHAAGISGADETVNRQAVQRLAPVVLAHLDIQVTEVNPRAGSALLRFRQVLSPPQFDRLREGCTELLLLLAEAQLNDDKGLMMEGARRAQTVLVTADALGRQSGATSPGVLHQLRARCLARLGDDLGAETAQKLARTTEAKTSLDYFLAALVDYRQNETSRAAQNCELALRLQPEHFWAQYLQALCYARAGRWAEVRPAATACLARRRDFLWALVLRGAASSELGEFGPAEADLNAALEQAKDPLARYVVLTNRGVFWVRQKRWEQALAEFDQAAALRPGDHHVHTSRALVYQQRGQWRQAIVALDQALADRPKDVELLSLRARLHLRSADEVSARLDLDRVIDQGGSSRWRVDALVERGHLLHRAREYEAALRDFDQAVSISPGYPPAERQRAQTLLALDRPRQAGHALDRYLATGNGQARDHQARGLIHTRLGEYSAAVEAFTRALQQERDPATLSYRGWVYLHLQAPRLALTDFAAALLHEPNQVDALCGRGQARVLLGQIEEGLSDVEKALAQGKPGKGVLLTAAGVYARAARELSLQTGIGDRADRQKQTLIRRYQARVGQLAEQAKSAAPKQKNRAEGEMEPAPGLGGMPF